MGKGEDMKRWTYLLAAAAVGFLGAAHSYERGGEHRAPPVRTEHEARAGAEAPAKAEAQAEDEAERLWRDLMAGNARFVRQSANPREFIETRRRLANGQQPKVIVLACADSRVSPELLFDKNLGELFVIRTAGNIADKVALGSIEYAVEHLHAPLLVVLGHERCGAVGAAASGGEMPTENLKAIVEQIQPAIKKVEGKASGAALTDLQVKANVHQSVVDIVRNSPIVREHLESGKLSVVKAVYDLDSGEVARQGKLVVVKAVLDLESGEVSSLGEPSGEAPKAPAPAKEELPRARMDDASREQGSAHRSYRDR